MCGGIYEEDLTHSDPMQNEHETNSMSEGRIGLIKVTKYEENEDGSAKLEIVTDDEATRFLVEAGLVSVLEKAIDADNKDYALSPELQSRELADEINEGFDALEEKDT
jgi:hypothetical protein